MAPHKMFHLTAVTMASVYFVISLAVVSVLADGFPINPDRAQLLKDAVGWMTFRKNGELMKDVELESLFMESLQQKYLSSKLYRSFVIAFHQGVIPRLTLNENDTCDPDYTWKYKDPLNSSVTWFYQKKFTFDSYDKQAGGGEQFCDYRQGLICKLDTRKCGCPEGSVMQAIDPGSTVKRCLLQENEICALIDLAHGSDPSHPDLVNMVPELIFNLEKPPSCKVGTQCRFKQTNLNTPLCYDANNGPWYPQDGNQDWTLDIGDECAIGLYANPGSCKKLEYGILNQPPGLVCYNFGPPRSLSKSGVANRTGFCASDYGPYGNGKGFVDSSGRIFTWTYYGIYIHPRTVPLRGAELRDFYTKFLEKDYSPGTSNLAYWVGDKCAVSNTKEMAEIWNYFTGLDKDPPSGQDYVPSANKTELEKWLQKAIDLHGKTNYWGYEKCRVYRYYFKFKPDDAPSTRPALECVPNRPGKDVGKCQEATTGLAESIKFADNFHNFIETTSAIENDRNGEEGTYRQDIVGNNPEPDCLSGGYPCPDGYLCFEDYGDHRGIYDAECQLLQSSQKFDHACHLKEEAHYGTCEMEQLDKMISQEVDKLDTGGHFNLGREESCQFTLEADIRSWIFERDTWHISKYELLFMLREERLSGGIAAAGGRGFCDRSKLLHCVFTSYDQSTCECEWNTQPRRVFVDGKEYKSDYCYFTEGSCDGKDVVKNMWFTTNEKEKIYEHYGRPSDPDLCTNGNVCVHLNETSNECRTINPANTVLVRPTVVNPQLPGGGGSGGGSGGSCCNSGGPGWHDVGSVGCLRGCEFVTASASAFLLAISLLI